MAIDLTWTEQTPVTQEDLSCRRCGYNLRGLARGGNCPECGVAISLSTHGDWLAWSSPDWISTLALGARCLFWGIIAAPLSIPMMSKFGLLSPIMLAGFILIGAWLITTREPINTPVRDSNPAPRTVRLFTLAGAAQGILFGFALGHPFAMDGLEWGLLALDAICLGIGLYLLLGHVKDIVLRMRNPQLWDDADVLRRRLALGAPMIILAATATRMSIAFFFLIPVVAFLWLWMVWYWVCLWRLMGSLSSQLSDHVPLAHEMGQRHQANP